MNALLDYVNILQGTNNSYAYSNGNTLPLCALPFGMTHWTLETTDQPEMFFSPHSSSFHGIRATHQPSPWIRDYGAVRFLPQTGPVITGREERFSCFNPQELQAAPHLLDLTCLRYQTRIELVPTLRCSWMRFTFPERQPKRILLDFLSENFRMSPDLNHKGLSGYTSQNSGGVPNTFAMYLVFELDCPITHIGEAEEGLYLELPEDTTVVNLKVGTSFISVDQARITLQNETTATDLEQMRDRARVAWESRLEAFEMKAEPEALKTFYSCLYRTLLFPRIFHEVTEEGKQLHYSPYDGQVHEGPLYADNGFWDTHRTVYPLFSLILGDEFEEMMQGWTNAAKEGGGWFPRWSSPGYRACMIGTHSDALIADAVVKGRRDFDVESAFQSMLNHAYTPGHVTRLYGRVGLEDYMQLGYLPSEDHVHAVSRTMDYAYNDFCIAQVARHLDDVETCRDLLQRSQNYRNVFNPQNGLMQGRTRQGDWVQDFSSFRWGGDYVEGSAWQCSWAVPHDVEGLMDLHGGRKPFIDRVESLFHMEPRFEVGAYGREIHEMAEMALADFGQYAHSNQPVHQVLWMWSYAGEKEKAYHWISRVVNELYGSGVDGFPGDEDNGEMSAWYIFAAMGIFPLCPGKPEYVRTRPQVERMEVTLGNGNTLSIRDPGPTWDSIPDLLQHKTLMKGGEV
jgi:predicted alpha-1,2-mannosidase